MGWAIFVYQWPRSPSQNRLSVVVCMWNLCVSVLGCSCPECQCECHCVLSVSVGVHPDVFQCPSRVSLSVSVSVSASVRVSQLMACLQSPRWNLHQPALWRYLRAPPPPPPPRHQTTTGAHPSSTLWSACRPGRVSGPLWLSADRRRPSYAVTRADRPLTPPAPRPRRRPRW